MIIIGGANLRKEGTKLAIITSTKDSNEKHSGHVSMRINERDALNK